MTTNLLAHRTGQALTSYWSGLPENAKPARHWLTKALAAEEPDVRLRAVTAASELITNALRHTASGLDGGRFSLTVDPGGPMIYIGVVDEGAAQMPVAAPLTPDLMDQLPVDDLPESGMGIALFLSAITVSWGFEPYGAGRLTWATIAR